MRERLEQEGQCGWRKWQAAERESAPLAPVWRETELADRQEDLEELRWLLGEIGRELALYRDAYPGGRFERELEAVFGRQAEALAKRVDELERGLETCELDVYLTVKYQIRTLFKQLGAIVAGSDWQSPCVRAGASAASSDEGAKAGPEAGMAAMESGYAQTEQNTYTRSYGSDAVKAYENAVLESLYPMPAGVRERSIGFVTTSGMKALELALVAYRRFTGERLPFHVQQGFYGEGAELADALLHAPKETAAEDICRMVEGNAPIGGLLVDPGMCWPVRPPVDLERLMDGLSRHRQREPFYVIVDRTLTSVANPLFERYARRLPPHITLIAVESGIKYLQYGLELANVGYLVAAGGRLGDPDTAETWVSLLALLDAGADPVTVRQLPAPDMLRLKARLARVNRNAGRVDELLGLLRQEGRIAGYHRSVDPSSRYLLDGVPWIGSVFYIELPGLRTEADYQRWADAFVSAAPPELHFVSGGSFGFDTFRMNAVTDPTGRESALRLSVGRDPLGQLMMKLTYLYRHLGVR